MDQTQQRPEPQMARIVDRNIRALLDHQRAGEREKSLSDRVADRITKFVGTMSFVWIHAVIFGVWILANVGWFPLLPRFDPMLTILAMAASVEAIFLSTFILITQNRMQASADRRANLDLQVSLLSEHEVTRLIHLVSAISRHLGVPEAHAPDLEELKQDVHPEKVLDHIEAAEAHQVTRHGVHT